MLSNWINYKFSLSPKTLIFPEQIFSNQVFFNTKDDVRITGINYLKFNFVRRKPEFKDLFPMLLNLVKPRYLRLYQISSLNLNLESTGNRYFPFLFQTDDSIIISEVGYFTLESFVIRISSMFTATTSLILVIFSYSSTKDKENSIA